MLLMAGIRERDKRGGGRFGDSMAYRNFVPRLFYVRNMFFLKNGRTLRMGSRRFTRLTES